MARRTTSKISRFGLPAALAAGLLAAGCEAPAESGVADEPEALEPLGTVDLPAAMTEEEATDPSVLLTADFRPGSEAGVTGTVRALALESGQAADDAGFALHVRVEGLAQGPHAWHIHAGPCSDREDVVVAFTRTGDQDALAGAEPLVPGGEGVAQQSVSVRADMLTFGQLRAGEYSLDVHEGNGTAAGDALACADL